MLEATCLLKLALWAGTAAAATLKAHDLELYALLADLGGRTLEASVDEHCRETPFRRNGTRWPEDHAHRAKP